ncbi:MAG: hypothetical protein HW405_496 [Candidatus Berkelbacteria bacterium]|nr:hypothetical protein [Candidatus Berkelbacteria bacterium]
MNQQPTKTTPKSRLKLLLIVLGIVIIAAILVYFLYVKRGSTSTNTTSPSPTTSSAVSSPTSSESGSTKTSTPEVDTTTSMSPSSNPNADKTFSGPISSYGGGCSSPTASFSYPSNYTLSQPKYSAGYGPIFIYGPNDDPAGQTNHSGVNLSNGYNTIGGFTGDYACGSPSSVQALFDEYKSAKEAALRTTFSVISNVYSQNNFTAINWQEAGRTEILGKTYNFTYYTTLALSSGEFVVITYNNTQDKDAYNTILNSFQFK